MKHYGFSIISARDNHNRSEFSFMIINFSIPLVNENRVYSIKPQRFEKVDVKRTYFTVMAIRPRH